MSLGNTKYDPVDLAHSPSPKLFCLYYEMNNEKLAGHTATELLPVLPLPQSCSRGGGVGGAQSTGEVGGCEGAPVLDDDHGQQ